MKPSQNPVQTTNGKSATPYAPRDVANAPAVKQAIEQRSIARQDSPEVAQWLGNHFYRHLIGNFEPQDKTACFAIQDLAQAKTLFLPLTVPDWVSKKFNQSQATQPPATQPPKIMWIEAHHPEVLALETKLVEFLNSRQGTALEGKLIKINCPQALQLWQAEHDLMAEWLNLGKQVHHPDAVTLFLPTEQGAFYEFLPNTPHFRAEMAYESQHMRHCLGQFANLTRLTGGYGEHYASSSEAGKLRIFSYRIANLPRITISVNVNADGSLSIDQLKGKQNRPPIEKYQQAVIAFLTQLGIVDKEMNSDIAAMDILQIHGQWQTADQITSEQDKQYVLQHYPSLSHRLTLDTPLLQWLAVVHHPDYFEHHKVLPEIRQTLNFAATSTHIK